VWRERRWFREREWLAAVGEGEEEGKYSAGRKATLSTFSCCTLSFRDQDAAERIKNSLHLSASPHNLTYAKKRARGTATTATAVEKGGGGGRTVYY
jgi:hypothetical protein